MDAIITFLVARWPWLVVAIVLVAVTIVICKWYFGRFVPTEKKADAAEAKLGKVDEIGKTVDALHCSKHDELLASIKEKTDDNGKRIEALPCSKHDESFVKIMEAITEIKTFLMVKNPKTAALFALKHSPLSLNEEGKKLFEDISGEEFLSANKEVLIACIDGKTPKTALDVEESALEVLYEHLDDDMFIGMKQWVYNSPSRKMKIRDQETDYTVTIDDVCFVLSLPLRDIYLELHPELK